MDHLIHWNFHQKNTLRYKDILFSGSLLEREGYLKKERHNKGTFVYSTITLSDKGKKLLMQLNRDPNMELRVTPTKEMVTILKNKKMQQV